MKTDFLRCDRCETILGGTVVNTPQPVPCPSCQTLLLTQVFPAFFRPAGAEEPRQEAVSSDEDASCYFHPRKKAVVPCANCGRFLCALCDLEFENRHLCPTCVETSRTKASAADKAIVREHMRYDYQALMLTAFPFFWWTAPITAPLGLYYALRYWNGPKQALIPRTHARQIIAIVLAVLQLGVWVVFIGASLTGRG
jgi:uncharacterized paraquat-inducible protein A